MAKFSVGREDGIEEPSNPCLKRQRTTVTRPPPPPPPPQEQQQHQPNQQQLVEDDEEELESEYEDEEEDGESEYDEEAEDEDEEEEEEEDEQNEAVRTNAGHPSNGVPCKNDREGGSVSVTLTDSYVLDCPICAKHLSMPVFQCENGHVACSSCCIKLGNKCPCSWPIGYNRCRAIEKVIESVKISCRNMEYGCEEKVSYSKKCDHEGACIYAPCLCPLHDCHYVGSDKQVFQHFSSKHSNSAEHFWYNCLFHINLETIQPYLFLQEQSDGIIFILNNEIDRLGNVINICCIGPSSSKRGFSYDLIASNGDSSVRLQSFTENTRGWVKHLPLKRFLVVPSRFFGSGQLKLQLCIWRHRDFPAHI